MWRTRDPKEHNHFGKQSQRFMVSYTYFCHLTLHRALWYLLKRNENIRLPKGLWKNVLNSFIYNSPKLYTVQEIHFGTTQGAFSDFAGCACTHLCVRGTHNFITHVVSGDCHGNGVNSLVLPLYSHTASTPHIPNPANLFFISIVISKMLYKWEHEIYIPLRLFFSFSIISLRFI